jgi:hypothetical protein
MLHRIRYIIIVVLLSSVKLLAQVPQKVIVQKDKNQIFVVAQASKNLILLRWAPSNATTWSYCNKYGFRIKRYTVMRDKKLLSPVELRSIKNIFKPLPLAKWDTIANNDDNAAVMAQAIYGEDFQVNMSNGNGAANIFNKSSEFQQRYSMSMYAADHSFSAAAYGGLAFMDANVKAGERYFYKVIPLVPKEIQKIDTGFVYIGLEDFVSLPKPKPLIAKFGDRVVSLFWDFEAFKKDYTSYHVEKSIDGGKTFKRITKQPYTNLSEVKNNDNKSMVMYLDSLSDNINKYYYRIVGLTLFGQSSPFSDTVSGKGVTQLPITPNISGLMPDDKGNFILKWEIDDSLNSFIQNFRIQVAPDENGPFKTFADNIPSDLREFTVKSLTSSNYYVVAAVPKGGGDIKTSMPYLLQPDDPTPPSVPVGLKGTLDSNGVVTIYWDANTETDLAGYKIFKRYSDKSDYSIVTDTLWKKNSFSDTLSLKSLNRNIYYALSALDVRANQSALCKPLLLIKPDVIPPSQPIFSDYEVLQNGIKLTWVASSDTDVVVHKLYKKDMNALNTSWINVKEFKSNTVSEYLDTAFAGGKTYTYSMIAVDRSNLQSKPSPPLTISTPTKRIKEAFKAVEIGADRENKSIILAWDIVADDIKEIELYKGEDKVPISLFKVLKANQKSFIDSELKINTKYSYAIRAIYTNGKYSDFVLKTVTY